jgi:tetraacyldisaccharide 4'-kinase
LGIDASRGRAARALAPHLPGGAFLLDDGFQHRRLHRDLDVVVVAAEERLATGALLPLGGLREPPSALARAHQIVVIAAPKERSPSGDDSDAEMPGALAEVARFAPHLPVAQARLSLRGLRPLGQAGLPLVAPETILGPVAALAGIARPERLAAGLAAAGMTVARRRHFPDHHRFTPGNLAAIQEASRGMAAVVTTEKDEPRLLLARAEPTSARFLDGVLILVAVMDLVFIAGEGELMRAVGAVAADRLIA